MRAPERQPQPQTRTITFHPLRFEYIFFRQIVAVNFPDLLSSSTLFVQIVIVTDGRRQRSEETHGSAKIRRVYQRKY